MHFAHLVVECSSYSTSSSSLTAFVEALPFAMGFIHPEHHQVKPSFKSSSTAFEVTIAIIEAEDYFVEVYEGQQFLALAFEVIGSLVVSMENGLLWLANVIEYAVPLKLRLRRVFIVAGASIIVITIRRSSQRKGPLQ